MKLMPLALALLSPIVAAAQTPPLIRDIASGHFTLVVKADGTVVGWGRDPDGQAARAVSANRVVTAPITIDLPGKVLQVAMGDTTQCALLEDGTVVAWGTNDEGQLGNGPTGASGELGRYPKPSITPVRVTGLTNIIQIEAGAKHAVALRTDGTVWAWGTRDDGAIGDGQPKTLRPVMAIGPTQVTGLQGITRIAAVGRHNLALSLGFGHAAALLRDGTLRMWGHGGYGQIGIGATSDDYHPKPVPVKGITNVSAIYLGNMRSLAVRTDGTAWIWGYASTGGQGILGKNLRVPTMVELP